MKRFIPFVLLMALVACSKDKDDKSHDKVITSSQNPVTDENPFELKQGMVVITSEQGETADINLVIPSMTKISKSSLSKEIILKVEEDKVYRLVEVTDLIKKITHRYVTLTIENPIQDFDRMIKENLGRVEGKTFFFKDYKSFPYEFNGHHLFSEVSIQGKAKMRNPHCDLSITRTQNFSLVVAEYEETLNGLETVAKSSCGKQLSPEDLKEIDLESITFCDNTREGLSSCEENQNLEHLTADL